MFDDLIRLLEAELRETGGLRPPAQLTTIRSLLESEPLPPLMQAEGQDQVRYVVALLLGLRLRVEALGLISSRTNLRPAEQAFLDNLAGLMAYEAGDVDAAMSFFCDAFLRARSDPAFRLRVSLNIAKVAWRLGKAGRAATHLHTIFDILDKESDISAEDAALILAHSYWLSRAGASEDDGQEYLRRLRLYTPVTGYEYSRTNRRTRYVIATLLVAELDTCIARGRIAAADQLLDEIEIMRQRVCSGYGSTSTEATWLTGVLADLDYRVALESGDARRLLVSAKQYVEAVVDTRVGGRDSPEGSRLILAINDTIVRLEMARDQEDEREKHILTEELRRYTERAQVVFCEESGQAALAMANYALAAADLAADSPEEERSLALAALGNAKSQASWLGEESEYLRLILASEEDALNRGGPPISTGHTSGQTLVLRRSATSAGFGRGSYVGWGDAARSVEISRPWGWAEPSDSSLEDFYGLDFHEVPAVSGSANELVLWRGSKGRGNDASPAVTAARFRRRIMAGRFRRRVLVGDAAAAAISVVASVFAVGVNRAGLVQSLAAAALPAVWLLLIALQGGYGSRLRPGTGSVGDVVQAGVWAFAGAAVISYAGGGLAPGDLMISWLPATLLLTLVFRHLASRWLYLQRMRGYGLKRVLLVGQGDVVSSLISELDGRPELGLVPVAALVPREGKPPSRNGKASPPLMNDPNRVFRVVDELVADVVAVVSPGGSSVQAMQRIERGLDRRGVELVVAPAWFASVRTGDGRRSGGQLSIPILSEGYFLDLSGGYFMGSRRLVKDLFDRVSAVVLLNLLLPIMAVIALLIKVTSPGPVLFRQTRVGLNGGEFTMLKFRTMVVDAEERRAELLATDGDGILFRMKRDPRITSVGAFLRRFSLDELPQLWNVARGDMSMVGPRPSLPEEVAGYAYEASRRLRVRPGLTGLWQVSGRSDLSWEESLRLDLRYVDNWSLLLDLNILFRTVRAVIKGSGAY